MKTKTEKVQLVTPAEAMADSVADSHAALLARVEMIEEDYRAKKYGFVRYLDELRCASEEFEQAVADILHKG